MQEVARINPYDGLILLDAVESLHKVTLSILDDPKKSPNLAIWRSMAFRIDPARQDLIAARFAAQECQRLSVFEVHSTLSVGFAAFEFSLGLLSKQLLLILSSQLKEKDFYGSGIQRSKLILSRMGGITVPLQGRQWETADRASRLRHRILHGGGLVDESDEHDQRFLLENGLETIRLQDGSELRLIKIEPNFIIEAFEAFKVMIKDTAKAVREKRC